MTPAPLAQAETILRRQKKAHSEGTSFQPTDDEKKILADTEPERLRLARVRALKRKYCAGDFLRPEEKKLIGVIDTPADPDEIFGGVEGIAQAINKEFPGANCHKVYVSAWLKGKRLGRNVPPMPPPHISGRHRRSLIFPWFREFKYKGRTPGAGRSTEEDPDYITRKQKVDALTAEFEFEQLKKAESDKYILRTDAQASVNEALKLHHIFVKRHFEKQLKAGVAAWFSKLGGGTGVTAVVIGGGTGVAPVVTGVAPGTALEPLERDRAQTVFEFFTRMAVSRGTRDTTAETAVPPNGFTQAQLASIAEGFAAIGKEIIRAIEEDCEKA